ncbi:hypothetical protein ACFO4E_17490 [Nocardiopsis mangrovi]|uniref:Uncharacterized protein n=1 Tax=Nocardiopsis mangrovi TaxID=1179818 RepID=A0ABV9DZX6_9ACTN
MAKVHSSRWSESTPPADGGVHLVTRDLSTLWGQIGTHPFSTLVGTEYDPETEEPVMPKLLTPLCRHDEAWTMAFRTAHLARLP